MKSFATITPFKEYNKVKYYTVILPGEKVSETMKFFEEAEGWDELKIKTQVNYLRQWIVDIGENRYAQEQLFRPERSAHALPPPPEHLSIAQKIRSGKNVRLYCLRLSDEVVILFNGGLKTRNEAQHCPNVKDHFYNANYWAGQLLKMSLILDGKEIRDYTKIQLKV